MVSSKIFTNVDGQTKRFLSDFIIESEQHCRVYNYLDGATPTSDDLVTLDKFDLIDNSIVFYTAPTLGTSIAIEVATTPEEFGGILTLPLVTLAEGYAAAASTSATTATAQVGIATTKAGEASASATTATTQAGIATTKATEASTSATTAATQAGIATTKATEASTSATNADSSATNSAASAASASTSASTATTQATNASNSATTATTQAGIATTKATEASTSATNAQLRSWEAEAKRLTADSYATEAEDLFVKSYTSNGDGTFTATNTTEYSALHWRNKAALAAAGQASNISYSNTTSGMVATNVQAAIDEIDTRSDSYKPLSGITAYHLLSGSLALVNNVITSGFATTLYTGNGATQTVTTGVDMATQWGNSASETFGGLVWAKGRSVATSNYLIDTIRGDTHEIYSNDTTADTTEATGLTAFSSTGFSLGALAGLNTNAATYASWVFQTTHRITGTTNHGKAYTCHYNPFTGFTIVKYEGSGLVGHEIPHHLGRKLGFATQKNLANAAANWRVYADGISSATTSLSLTTTDALYTDATYGYIATNDTLVLSTGAYYNQSGSQHIMYGWANSYFDEANTLIGNYEVGVYQGTGVTGNTVTTRGKPAWVMIKRVDATGAWCIFDNQRSATKMLLANTSDAEITTVVNVPFMNYGFRIDDTNSDRNALGGQYLYMVVYDNDNGSGKSKYTRATDTSTLNLNATVPFANGIDTNGTKNSILVKNEAISGLTLTEGKNYIYAKNNGTYGVTSVAPTYGNINPASGDFFNVLENKWYTSAGIAITESRNYLNAVVYADQNRQPTYVKQLPKTTYFDEVKANEFKGKNACTALVCFDGNTTPPTIKDSYNVKAVIRTAAGFFDIYLEKDMDNLNFVILGMGAYSAGAPGHIVLERDRTLNKISIQIINVNTTSANSSNSSIVIFGGKN